MSGIVKIIKKREMFVPHEIHQLDPFFIVLCSYFYNT